MIQVLQQKMQENQDKESSKSGSLAMSKDDSEENQPNYS